jgi:uncharacterized membrane protein
MLLNRFTMTSKIIVDAPVGRIWELITDAARWPEWCDICVQVEVIPPVWSSGNNLAFKLRMAGVAVPFRVTLTEVSPRQHVEWSSTKFAITATRRISLQPTPTGIGVTDAKTFHSSLLPIRLAYPRFLIRNMTEYWLADLKREAEGTASA